MLNAQEARPFMDLLNECAKAAPELACCLTARGGLPVCAYGLAFDALGAILPPGSCAVLVRINLDGEAVEQPVDMPGCSSPRRAFSEKDAALIWKGRSCGDVRRLLAVQHIAFVSDYIPNIVATAPRGERDPQGPRTGFCRTV